MATATGGAGTAAVGALTSSMASMTITSEPKLEFSPAGSMAAKKVAESWDDLPLSDALKAKAREIGWAKPLRVQGMSLPYTLDDKRPNMIVQSETGSGKSGVFILTGCHRVDPTKEGPQVIIMVPTKELVLMHAANFAKVAAAIMPGVVVQTVYGGVEYKDPVKGHVIVGTAGKLKALLGARGILSLRNVKCLVVDEADKMITDAYADTTAVADKCVGAQVLLFSATYDCLVPGEGGDARNVDFCNKLLGRGKGGATVADLTVPPSVKRVTHYVAKVKGGLDAKAAFIHGLFSSMPTGRALIFSNSGKNAHAVAAALLAAGTRCGAVASIDEAGKTLDMASRMVIFAEVSSGVTRLLATTDLYARGVDIPGLQVVVNLDPPKKHGGGGGGLDKTTFTHRCGRVGRVSPEGATVGVVINLANEESIEEPEYRDLAKLNGYTLYDLPADMKAVAEEVQASIRLPKHEAAAAAAGAAATA